VIKLVIFDMDGVLVDACDWHKIALNEALLEVSGYTISEDDHIKYYNGLPTKVKLRRMVELGFIAENHVNKIYNVKQQKTKEIIIHHASVDQGKMDLMRWIKEQNIHIACFTNSIRETAYMMLDKIGVVDSLELLVTNQDVISPKPSPEGYNKILNHFGVTPAEAIIVEDSPKGIQAAKETGCSVMQVKNAKEVVIKNLEEFINENFNSHGG
jgi:HAD superfamily hydrolase (TIGR01509 family)